VLARRLEGAPALLGVAWTREGVLPCGVIRGACEWSVCVHYMCVGIYLDRSYRWIRVCRVRKHSID